MQKPFLWPVSGHIDVRTANITSDLTFGWRRLLSPPYGQVEVSVAEVTRQGLEQHFLRSEVELRKHLSRYYHQGGDSEAHNSKEEESLACCPKSSFFVIEPHYGWSTLPITRDGLLSLFKDLDVFPDIYRFLTAFGRKEFAQDESFGGFDTNITTTKSGDCVGFELCYLLKYVAKVPDPPPGSFCWSIRHALIYQKVDTETNRSSHILIRLSTPAKSELAASLKTEGATSRFVHDWTYLHAVCFRGVDADLRDMINSLDKEITDLSDRVMMFGVEATKTDEINSVESSTRDFKSLQFVSDQARRVITCIQINMHTIECLQEKMDHIANWETFENVNSTPVRLLSTDLSKTLEEHRFACRNASSVLARATATSQFLRDTISLRNSEISRLNSEIVNQNTLMIARLAELSGRDAGVVKTLTVLALVFVPASFVADFLQMGFITIARESPMKWKADTDLKIYAILALPLITTTMLLYGFVEMISRSRKRT
ncbi:hypothetical protein FSST1_000205 [Fusarium sambucinum]